MVACYSLDYLVRVTNDSSSSPQTVWTSILTLIYWWNTGAKDNHRITFHLLLRDLSVLFMRYEE